MKKRQHQQNARIGSLAALAAVALLAPLSPARAHQAKTSAPQESKTLTNPIFPISFATPARWRVLKVQDNNAVLAPQGSGPVEVLLVAHLGLYEKQETLVTGLVASLKQLGCTQLEVREEGEAQVQGKRAYLARGRAQNAQAMPVEFALYSLLSGKQLGMGVVTLARPESSAEATRAAEGLIGSAQFGSFTPRKAAAEALAGVWTSSRAEGSQTSGVGGVQIASSTRYTFQSSGRFTSRAQSSVSASGEFGALGSSLSKDSDVTDEGQYFVVGTKLVLSSAKNGTQVLDYTLQGGLLKLGGALLRRN
jgi:hypothetical protein